MLMMRRRGWIILVAAVAAALGAWQYIVRPAGGGRAADQIANE